MIVVHANHLVQMGHDVCITTAVLDTVFTLDPRIVIKKLHVRNKLGTILSALKIKYESDLVIADIIPMVFLLSFRNRNKVVCFAQDYDESYYTSITQKSLIRLLYFVGLKIFRIPTIAVSHPLAELLRKRYCARVAVVENGVDTRVFYPEPDPELCVEKGNRKAVLLLSRSDQRKGFDIARDVIARLSASQSGDFEIWTVGEACPGFFTDLVHRDFGYIGEAKLRRIMSSADIFFYPTRHEGFPLMPLESLACGCPVVTTTAVPYGRNESAMKITNIGDADAMTYILKSLLGDGVLLDKCKRSSRLFAEAHSLDECKRQFEHLLAFVVGEKDENWN